MSLAQASSTGLRIGPGIEGDHPRPSSQRDRHQLVDLADAEYGVGVSRQPFGERGGRRGVVRGKEDGADLDHALALPGWRGKIWLARIEVKPRRHWGLRHFAASFAQ